MLIKLQSCQNVFDREENRLPKGQNFILADRYNHKGSFTIVNIYLLVQRVLI